MGLALLLSLGASYADSTDEKLVPALSSPSPQVNQSLLNRRLQAVKLDIKAFQSFAENFRSSGDLKTLLQLQNPVDDYLKKHVDNLLVQESEDSPLETTRLAAEVMFLKTRLFLSLNQVNSARNAVADMKKRFSHYLQMSVELPGKTTTLDEGIRLLDEELANTATPEKK